jgi:aconitase A
VEDTLAPGSVEFEAYEERRGWHTVLQDDGCTLWDSCLTCVLPECREDVGIDDASKAASAVGIAVMSRGRMAHPRIVKDVRDAEIIAAMKEGLSMSAAAKSLRIDLNRVRVTYYANGFKPVYFKIQPEVHRMIHALRNDGMGYRKIAAHLGIDTRTVRKYLDRDPEESLAVAI